MPDKVLKGPIGVILDAADGSTEARFALPTAIRRLVDEIAASGAAEG